MQNWKAERRGRRQASACGDPGLPLSISPSPRFPYSSTSLDKLWSVSFHSDTPSIFRLRTIHPGRLDAYRNCAHRPSDFTGLQSQETASVLVRYTTTLLLFHGLRFRFSNARRYLDLVYTSLGMFAFLFPLGRSLAPSLPPHWFLYVNRRSLLFPSSRSVRLS